MSTQPGAPPLLEAVDLSKHYRVGSALSRGGRRTVRAVDSVSFSIHAGETLGLVGESGCGKSTLARCIVRLHDCTSGTLRFEGRDITRLNAQNMRPLRPRLQMVFQDPYSSLNPRRRVGDLLAEPLRVHGMAGNFSTATVNSRVRQLADLVGLLPEQLERFPHEFSGGQRQRIGIARALALSPSLIVADEPVSALDVSIQAQIINLFSELQQRLGLTYIFIAHDLSVVRQMSTRTAVMYLGSIVELAPTDVVFAAPAHPYTAALIASVPAPHVRAGPRVVKAALAGDPPSPLDPPTGCHFHPRCPFGTDLCVSERPVLRDIGSGRSVACHFPLTQSRRNSTSASHVQER